MYYKIKEGDIFSTKVLAACAKRNRKLLSPKSHNPKKLLGEGGAMERSVVICSPVDKSFGYIHQSVTVDHSSRLSLAEEFSLT